MAVIKSMEPLSESKVAVFWIVGIVVIFLLDHDSEGPLPQLDASIARREPYCSGFFITALLSPLSIGDVFSVSVSIP